MNNRINKQICRNTLAAVVAGTLALGLAACDRDLSAERVGEDIDRAVDKTGKKISRAADQVEQKMDEAGTAVNEKAAKAGAALSDATITAKVKSALVAESDLQSKGIDVVTEKGVVSLYGTTTSDSDRQRATQLAANVEGVKSVENNLAVIRGS